MVDKIISFFHMIILFRGSFLLRYFDIHSTLAVLCTSFSQHHLVFLVFALLFNRIHLKIIR